MLAAERRAEEAVSLRDGFSRRRSQICRTARGGRKRKCRGAEAVATPFGDLLRAARQRVDIEGGWTA